MSGLNLIHFRAAIVVVLLYGQGGQLRAPNCLTHFLNCSAPDTVEHRHLELRYIELFFWSLIEDSRYRDSIVKS